MLAEEFFKKWYAAFAPKADPNLMKESVQADGVVRGIFSLGEIYQKIHEPSIGSQIFTLIYVAAPLAALILYAIISGLSQITLSFYIILMVVLAAALIWEIVALCLVIKER